jgi:hypothetical protein
MGAHNGSFLLFLPSLPAAATRKTLKQFVRQGLSDSGYRGLTLAMAVSRCSIIRVTDPTSGKSERHGIICIRPAKAAMDAMEVLQGRPLLGEPVQIRRYLQRSQAGSGDGNGVGERRRPDLKLEILDS